MKKISSLLLMLAALNASAQSLEVSAPTMSPCKWDDYYARQTTRTASPEEGEWLDYSIAKRDDGLYLHFIHENIELYCGIKVCCAAKINGNVITIDESIDLSEEDEYPDCICVYDVTYDVGPLQEGDYTLIVTFCGYKRAEMKVHIAEPLRGRFNIGEYVTRIEKVALSGVNESEIIYDLSGRRYKTFPHPGVFIQGGKKIVYKGR